MPDFSVVGKRVPRVEAVAKVTGTAVYSSDIQLPGMLYAKVLRSPYAHAIVKLIDTSKAQKLAGVKAVITAADVPGYKHKAELEFAELPHLAQKKVVYMEQPVAVVAADTIRTAEEALKLIKVEYEELPPIFDISEAVKPSAAVIHPGMFTNLMTFPRPGKDNKPSNISFSLNINRGNLDAGFKEADIVLENTFQTKPVNQGYLEPISAVASVDTNGKVTVWTQSQGIFITRGEIAEFLSIPLNKINVVQVEIGGAFGGKSYLAMGPLCALLAIKTGSPVKMVMTRDEVMKDGRPAAGSLVTIRMGATKKGFITAASISLLYDSGAYPEMAHSMFCGVNVFSQYRIPNLKIESRDVITNKVPATFYRSPAMPQASFAIESTIDLLAQALKIDPLELRIQNINQEGDATPNGEKLPPVGFKQALLEMSGYLKKKGPLQGKNRGRGIACGYWAGALGGFGAYVNLNTDGTISLITGVTDISGSRTSLAQIAAEEFQIPYESVTVVPGDTDTAPWATMSVGSMTVYSASVAVYKACQDAKAQLIALAARKLGVEAAQIEYIKGKFQVKSDPSKSLSLKDIAMNTAAFRGDGPVVGRGTIGGLPPGATLSVHAVDVEVDEDTGKIKVLDYTVVQDVGKAINPMSIEGQIQGAVTQGIGWALMEGYVFEKGALQNSTLLDYRLPTATDVPNLNVKILEIPSRDGIYGLRHVGEPPMIPVVAAMANAVQAATGVRFKELPMTPEAVLTGIKKKS